MRITRTVPARPVPITALVLATAGSLLLTPQTAVAEPRPPVHRETATEGPAAQTPLSAARRALAAAKSASAAEAAAEAASAAVLGDDSRGYPRRQVLAPTPRTRPTGPSSSVSPRTTPSRRS